MGCLGISDETWAKVMSCPLERNLSLDEKINEKKSVLRTHLSYD